MPYSEILSGGPGKDGIPAIDDPKFESIEEARAGSTGQGPVIALEIDGDARAYPLAVLTWHEIVNDTVGDDPGHRHLLPALPHRAGVRPHPRGDRP